MRGAQLASELREPQWILEIHFPEARLRAGLADRRAERAEDVITDQAVAHVAEPVELDDRLTQLRVPARQLDLASGHHDHLRVVLRRQQLLQALAPDQPGGAREDRPKAAHAMLTTGRSEDR